MVEVLTSVLNIVLFCNVTVDFRLHHRLTLAQTGVKSPVNEMLVLRNRGVLFPLFLIPFTKLRMMTEIKLLAFKAFGVPREVWLHGRWKL